jgi:DNA-binding SARP family transcriptional activator/TolB-like protein
MAMVDGRRSVAQLQILGGFRLTSRDGRDVTPKGAKARAMIAYLALAPGGSADRAKLSDLLWSESADAKTNLRQSLKEARQAFLDAGPGVLSADRYRVWLDLEGLSVDALEVDALIRLASGEALERLAALYAGPLLENLHIADPVFDDWLVVERERRHLQVCDALEQALRDDGSGRPPRETRRVAEALRRLEPTHEGAHRALMRLSGRQGDYPAAVRQYQRCREALLRDLGVPPSPETEELLRELRVGTAVRPTVAAPPAPVSAPSPSPCPIIAVEPITVVPNEAPDVAIGAVVETSVREALCRFRWFSVVDASTGLLGERGEAGRAPAGLDGAPGYAVNVRMLRLGDRARLTSILKHAETARVIWADHQDGAVCDVLELADDLAQILAAHLEREVYVAEVARTRRQPSDRLTPHDCVMRAIPLIYQMTPQSLGEADRLLRSATAMDPACGSAYNWRAFWQVINLGQQLVTDVPAAVEEIDWLTRTAIEHDPDDALALAMRGHMDAFIFHNYEQALTRFEHCLRLNPSLAFGWGMSAVTYRYIGNTNEVLRRMDRYRQL